MFYLTTHSTHFFNGYIGVGNILIGKMPIGYLTGIDLRSSRVRRARTPLGYRGACHRVGSLYRSNQC